MSLFPGHAANQLPDFAFDHRASRFPDSRFPAPIQLESWTVPADDRFQLHNDECQLPVRRKLGERPPEKAIAWTQLRVFVRLLEQSYLLSQCEILDHQLGSGMLVAEMTKSQVQKTCTMQRITCYMNWRTCLTDNGQNSDRRPRRHRGEPL